MSKQDNKTYDGIVFDSKLELNVYKYFQSVDEIEILELQPFFLLMEPFSYECLEKGKTRKFGKFSYKPDMRISIKGLDKEVIVEVKGMPRPEYMIRKKIWYNQNKNNYYFLEIRSVKKAKKIVGDILERILETDKKF